MKIYTKKGDGGSTSLMGGERVGKDDLRVEAYGTVDELSSTVAYLRDSMRGEATGLDLYREDLGAVLGTLMSVAALLSMGEKSEYKVSDISQSEIEHLERRMDTISETLPAIKYFTIPGGHPLVSLSHIARTVCRRAERAAVRASRTHDISQNAIAYLNRLSDYLYILGRKLTVELNVEEQVWVPSGSERVK